MKTMTILLSVLLSPISVSAATQQVIVNPSGGGHTISTYAARWGSAMPSMCRMAIPTGSSTNSIPIIRREGSGGMWG